MELRVFVFCIYSYLGLSHQMVSWIGVLKVKVDIDSRAWGSLDGREYLSHRISANDALSTYFIEVKALIDRPKRAVSDNTEAVTGLILIKENVAIAVAHEVSKLNNNNLRISARILFYQNDELLVCYNMGMRIHPEYYTNVLNTIALIFLKCNTSFWSLIYWPKENTEYKNNIFVIGLKDHKKGFSQVTYGVREVNASSCVNFYTNEGIDYKSLWPRNVMCVQASVKTQCVFDSGMALVHKNKEKWTLIGISVLGPGCALSARFIVLSPYIAWIERKLHSNVQSRRKNSNISMDMISESLDREDDFVIAKLNDSSMVMRTNLSREVDVHGECTNIDGEIMYKEEGRVVAKGYTATGTYALSLYDTLFAKITCVMIRVSCNQRTPSKLWYDRGFHQEELDHYIQTVPMYKRNQTVPPKIMYVKDRYAKHEKYETANIVFKFEFTNVAKIYVDFYARKVTTPIPPLADYLD